MGRWVGAAAGAGNDVIDLEQLEGEVAFAAVAKPFLLAVEDVLVLPVGDRGLDVGALRDVGARGDVAMVEEAAHGLLKTHVDQLGRLGGDIDSDPLAAKVVGGYAGGCAAAEGVEDDVALVGTSLDDALQEGQGLLGGIAGAFFCLRVNHVYVCPQVTRKLARIRR